MVVDEDGHIDITSGSIQLPGALGQGFIDLSPYILNARQLASGENFIAGTSAETAFWGGLLIQGATAGTPGLAMNSSADQAPYLNWTSAIVTAIKLPPVMLPPDVATAGGLSVRLYGENVGTATAADAAMAFDVRCWSGVGDTEMGTTCPNLTTTPANSAISIASGDIVANGPFNITLVPQAHAGRALRLFGGSITYTRKTS